MIPLEIRCLSASLMLVCLGAAQGEADTVTQIQGAAVTGAVQSIEPGGAIAVRKADGSVAAIDLGGVRRIEFGARNPAPVPRQGMVLLRSGVEVPATVRDCAGRQLTITSPLIEGEVKFSLTRVQAIRFAKLPMAEQGGFNKYLRAPKEDADLLYFKSGERVVQQSVTVEGFEGDSLIYEARGKTRNRKISSLYGLIMSQTSGFRADALPRPRVIVMMQGGAKLAGRLDGLDSKTCKLFTEEQVALNLVRSRVTGLVVESDRLVFLADMRPSKVEQTAAFRTKKPWLVNRSPAGEGIHIGGPNPRTADNGLVLIPRTGLTYDIGGRFDFFQAVLCIDARSTGPAHAVFRVKGSGRVLYESKPVTRQSDPLPIKVDIGKVKHLTLEVDFGKNYDLGDHCAFAEARVVKRGP